MGITIREPAEGDFFSWLAIYEDYAAANQRQLTDQGALLVWSWLTDAASSEHGLVAVDDAGALVGLVHYHVVPRPLDGDHALHVDDLFVLEEHRQEGTGHALIDAVGAVAAASGVTVVQWYASPGDAESRAFYDQIGDAAGVVIYRLRGAQPTVEQVAYAPPAEPAESVEPIQSEETAPHQDLAAAGGAIEGDDGLSEGQEGGTAAADASTEGGPDEAGPTDNENTDHEQPNDEYTEQPADAETSAHSEA